MEERKDAKKLQVAKWISATHTGGGVHQNWLTLSMTARKLKASSFQ